MKDVVALGEVLIDFACCSADASGYPILAAQPGGAPANFLSALQCYGCSTGFIGKVGDDAFGHLLKITLDSQGIDTQGLVFDPSVFTTLAFVTLDATGNREFSFARKPGADTNLHSSEVAISLLEGARVFHFGSLSLSDEPSRSATQFALSQAKAHRCLISYDPNFRKPLWKNDQIARKQIEWGLHQADIVKISDEEIGFLWDISPEQGAKKFLNEFGASLVYVTLGPNGCYFSNSSADGYVATPCNIHVVDTTGAGDIFGGSAMSRFLKTGKTPSELDAMELRDIVRFACCAASLSTQNHGGLTSLLPEKQVVECVESNYPYNTL